MDELINKLRYTIPDINFVKGNLFCWSPSTQTINYKTEEQLTAPSAWALLHETGHALLGHEDYRSDIELVMLEAAAWQRAKALGDEIGITIDEDHIQDCLDTYRDWLHQRSTCPRCGSISLQSAPQQYTCHNCACVWRVSSARFCRPYRLTKTNTKRPLSEPTALSTTFL